MQLFKKLSQNSDQPYNINWYRNFDFLAPELSKNPINMVDIGARGGSCGELEPLQKHINYLGFDADENEANSLNSSPPKGYLSFKVFSNFVGSKAGEIDFHLYKNLWSSSQLLPNAKYQKYFDSDLQVSKTISVDGITLDEFLSKHKLDIDILKLDTQGTEFDVLSNGHVALDSALMVETEVEFVEMYQGQKLYHDLAKLLYEKGYVLLYLNRVFGNRQKYKGITKGQLVFGDALFGLNQDRAERLDPKRQFKYCTLLINYGHIDFAYDIFCANSTLQKDYPSLKFFFEQEQKRNANFFRRKLIKILRRMDRFIYWLLSNRRANRLSPNSDRSWPIR